VRTPASLFNTDFEDANLHRRQRVTHHQVSTTRERPQGHNPLQWNSLVVAVCGWHLHRRHRGPQFLIDTTNTGWDFYLAPARTPAWPPVGTFSRPRTGRRFAEAASGDDDWRRKLRVAARRYAERMFDVARGLPLRDCSSTCIDRHIRNPDPGRLTRSAATHTSTESPVVTAPIGP
jgi:hypothetical protein